MKNSFYDKIKTGNRLSEENCFRNNSNRIDINFDIKSKSRYLSINCYKV